MVAAAGKKWRGEGPRKGKKEINHKRSQHLYENK
jgi:hypothetical protein